MRVIIILIISFCLFFNILSQNNKIKYPEIPENIISRSERMNYICVHFWDNTEFEDENILNDITGFKDFIYLLTHVPDSVAKIGVTNLLIRCMDNNAALSRVDDILKQYFDNSLSIYKDEEMYVMILREMLKLPLNEYYKVRAQFRIEMAMKNRVGDIASNLSFVYNNKTCQLYDISSPYILLYFNSSECHECKEAKRKLEKSERIRNVLSSGMLKVLSIDIIGNKPEQKELAGWINGFDVNYLLDEELLYFIQTVPTFYLLDKNKRVLLKDVSVDKIISYIDSVRNL